MDSGLVDTNSDNKVFLFEEGGHIVGRVGTGADASDAAGAIVFVIGVDADTGEVEVAQYRAVKHDDATDPDEASTPEIMDSGVALLEVTVEDGDGDTDSDTVDLGGVIKFEDDGPIADVEIQQEAMLKVLNGLNIIQGQHQNLHHASRPHMKGHGIRYAEH